MTLDTWKGADHIVATYHLTTQQLPEFAPQLRILDRVFLSGTVYTARDAAHKRIFALLEEGKELPFPLKDSVVYYAGPTPEPEGLPIGSCGPTTSGRMDPYAPKLLDLGMRAMVGKGERAKPVKDAIVRNGGVYFCAIGGAGALACRCIKSCQVIAFEDLGCESVKKLEFEEFPLIVAIDAAGGDIFEEGPKTYLAQQEQAKA